MVMHVAHLQWNANAGADNATAITPCQRLKNATTRPHSATLRPSDSATHAYSSVIVGGRVSLFTRRRAKALAGSA